MGTSRIIQQSITGRKIALAKAKYTKDGVAVPTDNILSKVTSDRLDEGFTNYNAGINAIKSAKEVYHTAVGLAKPQRIKLKKNTISYFKTLNTCIELGTIPDTARVYYDLDITNGKMPNVNTDDKLLAVAAVVLSGDIARKAAGGIAMSNPTILEFTTVYNAAKPVLVALNNARIAVFTAVGNLADQTVEIKDLITHIWDEVEAFYSLKNPPNRRAICRVWGVRYRSTGISSIVTGTCKDELGVVLKGVKVRIVSSSHFVYTDAEGNFSLNTSLYGDLEILATLAKYEKSTTDFSKEDGVAIAVHVVMILSI